MIKSLEGGRGIAALIVAFFHLKIGIEYFSIIRNGYIFVDLFFVLSGFVIYSSYANRLNAFRDVGSFVIRRFGRLFPLLIFSTMFYIFSGNIIVLAKKLAIAHGYSTALNNPEALAYVIPDPQEIFSTLTMTHGLDVFDKLILNTPSWSISTEFYTYLLFCMLSMTLSGKARLLAFAIVSLVGGLISINASLHIHDCLRIGGCLSLTYDFGFPRTVYSFFIGALACHLSRSIQINSQVLQGTGAFFLALGFLAIDNFPSVAFVFPLIFAALIISVCKDTGWLAELLKKSPFQLLGERSYSIYMLHMPLVMFFENIAKRTEGFFLNTLILIIYTVTLIVISGWTYKFIEDPCRAMFNRIAARRVIAPVKADA